jgi:hypothetical protein
MGGFFSKNNDSEKKEYCINVWGEGKNAIVKRLLVDICNEQLVGIGKNMTLDQFRKMVDDEGLAAAGRSESVRAQLDKQINLLTGEKADEIKQKIAYCEDMMEGLQSDTDLACKKVALGDKNITQEEFKKKAQRMANLITNTSYQKGGRKRSQKGGRKRSQKGGRKKSQKGGRKRSQKGGRKKSKRNNSKK